MGYPRKLLNDGETIVLELHPHWRVFLAPLFLLVIGLGAVAAVTALVPSDPIWNYVAAAPFALALLWLIGRWISWRATHFVLSTDRVISRTGVISKKSLYIPLERIDNVASSQRVIERLLGVGDLMIESAGETGRQTFTDIGKPSEVERRIYAEMEREQARDARAGMSVADELEKLDQLRRRGLLSEEEYAEQRARLLG